MLGSLTTSFCIILPMSFQHEMIHAYLFVTAKNKVSHCFAKFYAAVNHITVVLNHVTYVLCTSQNHDAHGPEFCKHMTRINSLTGARITVRPTYCDVFS